MAEPDLIQAMARSARAALESGRFSAAAKLCEALAELSVWTAVDSAAHDAWSLAQQADRLVNVPMAGPTRDEQPVRYACKVCGEDAQSFTRIGSDEWEHDMHISTLGYPFRAGDGHEPRRP